jgi:hypothetical protein
MNAAIPASAIVSSNPGVLSAGGTALDLVGLFLSNSIQVPIGTVGSFASAAAVGGYFGLSSPEYAAAEVCFAGYDNSFVKPAALLFAQYPAVAVSGYTRGGSGLTLAAIKAITPASMAVTVDGTLKTSSTITLSGATSPSNAASIIAAAFSSFGATCTWDSVIGAFVITSSSTGVNSSIAVTSGAMATALQLTTATGAVVSPGSAAASSSTFMTGVVAQTQNFVSFSTIFEPGTTDKVNFAAWNNGQNNRYAYVMWDSNSAPTTNADTSSAGYLINQAGYSGTCCIYTTQAYLMGAFVMGAGASIDFEQEKGRVSFAFLAQAGLSADVTNQTIAANLIANGYNFYGTYGTANDMFTFFYPGSVSGEFLWLDSYYNQIWMNNAFQLALIVLETSVGSVPYDQSGYATIRLTLLTPIGAAVNFGAIASGVSLSGSQIAKANALAGTDISSPLQTVGWYLSVKDPGPIARQARTTPVILFLYTDGGSVQQLSLSSLDIQ